MPEPPSPESSGTSRYDFSFGPATPYAHAMELIRQCRTPDGEVVVDLGCGFGAIAEPTRALGLGYLGVDREASGVRSLIERGSEALVADLSTPDAIVGTVTGALRGRGLAAITMLDFAEHLPNAATVLAALSAFSRSAGEAPLVVSIPNVSHRDVAGKLLLGRWDVTTTGLLDETHVRFFAPATLERQMRETGWEEIGARDFSLEVSDQFFPEDCVGLLPWTPLGALLHRIRGHAAPGATTNQFVRAYRPTARLEPGASGEGGDAREADRDARIRTKTAGETFLSVVVRSRGSEAALQATFSALDHEDLAGVEVLVVSEAEDGPEGVDRALCGAVGRYVALLCEGDLPSPGWAATLAAGAAAHPGRVLLVGVEGKRSGGEGGLIGLVANPPGSLAPYALPRSLFSDLGVRVALRPDRGDGAPVDWPLLEWHLLVRAVELCGLVPLDELGIARLAPSQAGRRITEVHLALLAVLDELPILLDRNAASALASLHRRAAELELARDHASTIRRVTAPLRAAIAWYRRR